MLQQTVIDVAAEYAVQMNEAMNEFEESLMATIKMVQTVNEQTIEVSSVSPDEEE